LTYVEGLVGPDTVDTVPPATLEALRRGATIRDTLEEEVGLARAQLAALERHGISIDAVADEVLGEGMRKFAEPFRRLLAAIDVRRAALGAPAAH
jgi:transaldolase